MPTIENVVNQALDVIGYSDHIGNIYEGSKASIIALNTFGQTRDEALALQPWYFARSEALLPAVSSAQPYPPWAYEFLYPPDAIRLLMLAPSLPTAPVQFDPAPVRWREYYDRNLSPPQRTILATFSPAWAVYTIRVIDTSQWPPEFIATVIQLLAKKFETELGRPLPQRPQRPPQQQQQEQPPQ
jgi:hypothetical protein